MVTCPRFFLQEIRMDGFTGLISSNEKAGPQLKYLDGAFCALVVDEAAFGI